MDIDFALLSRRTFLNQKACGRSLFDCVGHTLQVYDVDWLLFTTVSKYQQKFRVSSHAAEMRQLGGAGSYWLRLATADAAPRPVREDFISYGIL